MKQAVGVLALALTVAMVAPGEQVAQADDLDELIRTGVELRRQGKEQEALETFLRAAQIKKTARVMAQTAFAEQALGQWVKAEAHLKIALLDKGDPWMVKNRAVIDDALRTIEDHLGSLEVRGTPAGAEVLIDAQAVGTLPSSGVVRLPLGQVTVTVRKAAHADVTRTVQIVKGGLVRESVDLHPLPARPPGAFDPQLAAGAGSSAAAGGALIGTERSDPSSGPASDSADGRPVYKRWWFWTLVGVAAVGAGAGAFFLAHRGTATMACDPGVTCGVWGALRGEN